MSWFDVIDSVGIVGAFAIGADQIRRGVRDARRRDEDRRTERTLELYRDVVVDGETSLAFHRLSVLLRRLGTERHGRTTWLLLSDEEFGRGGLLDPTKPELDTPFQDLYQVIWYFERVEMSIRYGLVDQDVLYRTVGFHCWWWAQILRNIHTPKAARALKLLAPQARDWAVANDEYERWVAHCADDFDGGGPREEADDVPRASVTVPAESPRRPGSRAARRRRRAAEEERR